VVYARRLGERTLTFGVSGKLWNDALVMYDRETRSLWSHVTGSCIEGKLEGGELEFLEGSLYKFSDWATRYPKSLVLARPAGSEAASRYETYAASDRQGIFGTQAARDDLPAKALVQGVTWNGEAAAVPHDTLAVRDTVAFGLGGARFETVRDGSTIRVERIAADGMRRVEPSTAVYWFAWLNFYPRAKVAR